LQIENVVTGVVKNDILRWAMAPHGCGSNSNICCCI